MSDFSAYGPMLAILRIFKACDHRRYLIFRPQRAQRPRRFDANFVDEILLHRLGKRRFSRRVDLYFRADQGRIRLNQSALHLVEDRTDRAGFLDEDIEAQQRIDRLRANVFVEIVPQRLGKNRNGGCIADPAERRNHFRANVAFRLFLQRSSECRNGFLVSQYSHLFNGGLPLFGTCAVQRRALKAGKR